MKLAFRRKMTIVALGLAALLAVLALPTIERFVLIKFDCQEEASTVALAAPHC